MFDSADTDRRFPPCGGGPGWIISNAYPSRATAPEARVYAGSSAGPPDQGGAVPSRGRSGERRGAPHPEPKSPARPPVKGFRRLDGFDLNTLTPTRDDFTALLNETYGADEAFEGSVVKGRVVAIEKDMALIDIGLKTEGRVALKEFTNHGRETAPGVGDEVEVYLERIENALGEAVISRDKARREESWVKLEQAFEKQEKVEGVIFNQVKGGFTVDLDGAVAFLPRSQVDIRPVRDVAPLMNVPQPFQILKMDRRRGNIVVSRRTVLEESRAEQRHEIVANLAEGQVIDGTVKNITDYGAFVDLGGIDGLLHVTNIAWRRVNHPTEVLNIGQHGQGADHQDQPRDAPHLAGHEAASGRPVVEHRGALSGRSEAAKAASPTSPTTARSSSWSRASRA